MTKKLIIPNTLHIDSFLPYVDAFLFGIKGYTINQYQSFSYEEVKPVIQKLKEQKKEVYLNLNKNMHEQDLTGLSQLLEQLETIDGIFYYDVAVLHLVQKKNLNLNLIWAQEHMTTNFHTVSYWNQQGTMGTLLSAEITLKEILEIRKSTESILFVPIFGYLPMFTSRRKLLTNYLDTFSLPAKQEGIYFMEKEGKTYPLLETEEGFSAYSSFLLNGLREYFILQQHNIDYVCFNAFLLKEKVLEEVLQIWNDTTEKNVETQLSQLDQLLLHQTETGFFYHETVYRVKA